MRPTACWTWALRSSCARSWLCWMLAKQQQQQGSTSDARGPAKSRPRTTALLSATLHAGLSGLATVSLHDPVAAGFTLSKAAGHASATGSAERRKAVVFLSSCDGVELHWELLGRCWHSASGGPLLGREVPMLKLHGDMPQAQRTSSFVTFSEAPCAVLLCTDVAARGLDFPDVTVIIQYDVAGAMEDSGALTAGRNARGAASRAPSSREAVKPMALAFNLQRKLMQVVGHDTQLRQLAADAFRSFTRAYAAHTADVKKVFHVRNLHLGHIAFAHALKDTPTMLGSSGSATERKRKRVEELASKQRVAKKALYKKAAAIS
ncbi:RNA helicase [Haematococcus lacustris]|uniref:ATP-dependent RNA helicase n=1 Tax=Haematococcus lacustris TaxID=44745 RepID=A0A699YPE2_HAELA|nr:RNA helicase [Haematococcus lacustris]